MAYVLEALLVTRIVVPGAAIDAYPSVAVPLAAVPNLALVPITEAVRTAMSSGSEEPIFGFYALTEGIAHWSQQLSRDGAVAYVHAEHSGGPGFQAAIGWRAGLVGFGPIFTQDQAGEAEAWYSVPADGRSGLAINEALRWLGVKRGRWLDEFEAVGLGRHRSTAEWTATDGDQGGQPSLA